MQSPVVGHGFERNGSLYGLLQDAGHGGREHRLGGGDNVGAEGGVGGVGGPQRRGLGLPRAQVGVGVSGGGCAGVRVACTRECS